VDRESLRSCTTVSSQASTIFNPTSPDFQDQCPPEQKVLGGRSAPPPAPKRRRTSTLGARTGTWLGRGLGRQGRLRAAVASLQRKVAMMGIDSPVLALVLLCLQISLQRCCSKSQRPCPLCNQLCQPPRCVQPEHHIHDRKEESAFSSQ